MGLTFVFGIPVAVTKTLEWKAILFAFVLWAGIRFAINATVDWRIRLRLERDDLQRKADCLPPYVAWIEYHIRRHEDKGPYFVCYFDADYKVVGRQGPPYGTQELAALAAKEVELKPEFRSAIQR